MTDIEFQREVAIVREERIVDQLMISSELAAKLRRAFLEAYERQHINSSFQVYSRPKDDDPLETITLETKGRLGVTLKLVVKGG